jgi:hypothetical protein
MHRHFLSFVSQMKLRNLRNPRGIGRSRRPAIEDIAMLDKQMNSAKRSSGLLAWCRATLTTASVLTAAGFGLAGGAVAGEIKDEPRWTHGNDYSSLKDWHLKGENIVPHGVNPLYYPIMPGHKHVHERPDHPDGFYRKETVVLDGTEDFDIPGIGLCRRAQAPCPGGHIYITAAETRP